MKKQKEELSVFFSAYRYTSDGPIPGGGILMLKVNDLDLLRKTVKKISRMEKEKFDLRQVDFDKKHPGYNFIMTRGYGEDKKNDISRIKKDMDIIRKYFPNVPGTIDI